jgi:hypothetical protein
MYKHSSKPKMAMPTWRWVVAWKKNRFKIFIYSSILIIFIAWLYKDHHSQGTWDTNYHYDEPIKNYFNQIKNKKHFTQMSKGEAECRRIVENIFGVPFPNQRPLFLMNTITNKKLEIDCCNLDLGLGVEYNGVQHYKYTPGFHKNHETFRLQQYRDHLKKKLCEDNNFSLLVVPYTIPLGEIELFIRNGLHRMGYNVN